MTIKDIAKLAGVSTATVSRVINNKSGVKEEVRSNVKKVMEQHDYTPNLVARGLVTNKSNVIGMFVPRFSAYYAPRIDAIIEYCNNENYGVMVGGAVGKFEGRTKSLNMLYEKQVEGLIYFVGKLDKIDEELIKKISKKIPVVLVDQSITDSGIPSILPDNYDGARKAMNYLIDNGHREIAFIAGPKYDREGYKRLEAYKETLKENSIEIKKTYIEMGFYSLDSGYKAMQRILDNSENSPTAVLGGNDLMAIGAINCLKDNGYKIPEDISVMGIDDLPISSYYNPRLTTIRQDQSEIGQEAVKLIFDMINGDKIKIKKIVMEQELVVRESVLKI